MDKIVQSGWLIDWYRVQFYNVSDNTEKEVSRICFFD